MSRPHPRDSMGDPLKELLPHILAIRGSSANLDPSGRRFDGRPLATIQLGGHGADDGRDG